MQNLSQGEVSFIAKAIESTIRMDMRRMDEKRAQTITETSAHASALADSAVQVSRGYSQVCLSVSFRSSYRTLAALNLTLGKEHVSSDEFKTLKCALSDTNPSFKIIEDFLNSFNIGCYIEVYIIRNDGNIFDMIFDGLKHIFSSIAVPNVCNLSENIQSGVDLPACTSYAMFGPKMVLDPTRLEEQSSDGIVRIFDTNGVKCVLAEGSIDFDILKSAIRL